MLALVGGGEWSPGCTFDQVLLDASGATEVAVLPTGSAYENPGHLVEQARQWFAGLGADVREVAVLTRRDAALAEHVDALRSARMIYLAGTSAMHVRSVLKETPVFEALLEAWAGGAALAGTNAGADVLCDPMVDSRGGAFTVGLGVVSQLSIIPRVEQWSRDKVHRTVELAPRGLSLVGIPSATALLRDADGAWRAEGSAVDDVSVFIDGRPATVAELTA
jgi:cyanophycinase